jgi:large subunit ribosomal protein L13
MKTVSANAQTAQHDWYVLDVDGLILGRTATQIASMLRGKHKPEFTPHTDTGDYIVVVNADKVRVTGKKAQDKFYYTHSNYPGGLKAVNFTQLIARTPERVLETAVRGMLPRGPLGRTMFKKLKVYSGKEHPHAAQNPRTLSL